MTATLVHPLVEKEVTYAHTAVLSLARREPTTTWSQQRAATSEGLWKEPFL